MFAALLHRDLLLAWRSRADVLVSLTFFIIVACLFPFGVGSDKELLISIGPGVLWVAALLSVLLSLNRLFAQDYADGTGATPWLLLLGAGDLAALSLAPLACAAALRLAVESG